jgi:hypothetical protein
MITNYIKLVSLMSKLPRILYVKYKTLLKANQ